jgi:Spy/CpxP family protein refolding chaperone
MRKLFWMSALLLAAVPLLGWSQTGRAPYAGQELRQIKSLSDEEVRAYLDGRGMGLAKPAELNGYPGPMHVLELAAKLELSEDQRARTQKAFEEMRAEAVRLGRLIVGKEADLNRAFAEGKVDANGLQQAVAEIARLQGELRVAHLRAHLTVKSLLSPRQVKRYDELRGYGVKEGGPHQGHGKH